MPARGSTSIADAADGQRRGAARARPSGSGRGAARGRKSARGGGTGKPASARIGSSSSIRANGAATWTPPSFWSAPSVWKDRLYQPSRRAIGPLSIKATWVRRTGITTSDKVNRPRRRLRPGLRAGQAEAEIARHRAGDARHQAEQQQERDQHERDAKRRDSRRPRGAFRREPVLHVDQAELLEILQHREDHGEEEQGEIEQARIEEPAETEREQDRLLGRRGRRGASLWPRRMMSRSA